MLGHLQVHKKGYVASIDNLPLNMMMTPNAAGKVEQELKKIDAVEAWSPRIKFGAMFSNFNETTNIRLNAVYPQQEQATSPLLADRSTHSKSRLPAHYWLTVFWRGMFPAVYWKRGPFWYRS
jgi:putative ABC transport system permease protein